MPDDTQTKLLEQIDQRLAPMLIHSGFVDGNIYMIKKALANLGLESMRRELKATRPDNDLIFSEAQTYSQNGEDGIIREIFKRIGTTNEYFVEVGVGNGLENNTTNLLLKNWSGCWVECDKDAVYAIRQTFKDVLASGRLKLKEEFINAANIEVVLRELVVPESPDLLSIDIDGNDYWVWNSITNFKPRVVVMEYNGSFDSQTNWVMKYDPTYVWNRTNYYGASLKSLELLGRQKGYRLVGCNISGINAFFVRNDLVKGRFWGSGKAEEYYRPINMTVDLQGGHFRGWGPYSQV